MENMGRLDGKTLVVLKLVETPRLQAKILFAIGLTNLRLLPP